MIEAADIRAALPHALLHVELPELGPRVEGKVRDAFVVDGQRILVTTDRVSAFDRVVGAIPFKGQVLNQLSAWWFEQTRDLVGNHVASIPDPNVTVAHEAAPLPVEVIVRGYITGVTSTSLWTLYSQGVDKPYGLTLPSGLKRNDALPEPVITPTTKATGGAHDERLTPDEVVSQGLVEAKLWSEVQLVALEVFRRGQEVAARAGLILVDTKYEMGLDKDGKITLIDEVHTPDSSRYWYADDYEQRFENGENPRSLDKEFVRRSLIEAGFSGEGEPPTLDDELRVEAAKRYAEILSVVTGEAFEGDARDPEKRIRSALGL